MTAQEKLEQKARALARAHAFVNCGKGHTLAVTADELFLFLEDQRELSQMLLEAANERVRTTKELFRREQELMSMLKDKRATNY